MVDHNKWENLKEEVRQWEEINKENILDFIRGLPSPDDQDFKRQLSALLTVNDQKKTTNKVRFILDLEDDPSITLEIRFACFYYLSSYYRRRRERKDLADLHDDFENDFLGEACDNRRIQSMCELLKIHQLSIQNRYPEAIKRVEDLRKEHSDYNSHKEILHTHATLLVDYVESDSFPDGEDREEKVQTAEDIIEKVLDEDDQYGRYHYTKARVLTLQERFSEARIALKEATLAEDPDMYDYQIRMSMYHKQYPEITAGEVDSKLKEEKNIIGNEVGELQNEIKQVRTEMKDAQEEMKKARDQAGELQGRFVLFLGFFTGVLTIVVAFLGSNQGFTFLQSLQQSFQYILALVSALLFGFGGFVIIFPFGELKESLYLIGLSIVGFAGSIKGVPWFVKLSFENIPWYAAFILLIPVAALVVYAMDENMVHRANS